VQQASEPAGQEHTTVGVVQVSWAVAEITMGASPQLAEAAEMAQVMVGLVVSTTTSEVEHWQLRPVQAEVAEKLKLTPLFA